jgi:hypothetical protein
MQVACQFLFLFVFNEIAQKELCCPHSSASLARQLLPLEKLIAMVGVLGGAKFY